MNADDPSFQSLNLAQVQNDLLKLYQKIACEKGRVEIVSQTNGACECVLISKAELDGLERAIAVLSDSDGVREVSHQIATLALATTPIHSGA
jgi:hypothetical protein